MVVDGGIFERLVTFKSSWTYKVAWVSVVAYLRQTSIAEDRDRSDHLAYRSGRYHARSSQCFASAPRGDPARWSWLNDAVAWRPRRTTTHSISQFSVFIHHRSGKALQAVPLLN